MKVFNVVRTTLLKDIWENIEAENAQEAIVKSLAKLPSQTVPNFGPVECHSMFEAIEMVLIDRAEGCRVPPDGWLCTRKAGHDGPCAAVPVEAK